MTRMITHDTYRGPDRRNGGDGTLRWWLLGLASSVVLAGGMAWLTNINQKVEALTDTDLRREGQISTVITQNIDILRRVSTIEAKQDEMQSYWYRRLGTK